MIVALFEWSRAMIVLAILLFAVVAAVMKEQMQHDAATFIDTTFAVQDGAIQNAIAQQAQQTAGAGPFTASANLGQQQLCADGTQASCLLTVTVSYTIAGGSLSGGSANSECANMQTYAAVNEQCVTYTLQATAYTTGNLVIATRTHRVTMQTLAVAPYAREVAFEDDSDGAEAAAAGGNRSGCNSASPTDCRENANGPQDSTLIQPVLACEDNPSQNGYCNGATPAPVGSFQTRAINDQNAVTGAIPR